MAVRQLNGSSDWIDFALPANIAGASTVLAVVKRTSDTSGWSSVYCHTNSSNTGAITFELEGSTGHQGGLSLEQGGNFSEQFTNTFLTADGWGIIGYSAPSAGTPKFHISKNGAAFTHTNGGSTVNLPGSQSGGKLTVGRYLSAGVGSDFAALKIAAIFLFTSQLSDATIDGLIGKTKADFISAGAVAGWEFNQSSTGTAVPDLIGSANQSAISGTTVVTGDDPPSGVYTLTSSSTDATVTAVPADGTGASPAPVVSAGSSVTAPPADGTGAFPAPVVTGGQVVIPPPADATGAAPVPTVSAGGSVVAPAADATGQFPADLPLSVTVTTGPFSATGAAPAPVVTGGSDASDATVTAVPADGTGASPVPGVSAGSSVTGTPADGTGQFPPPGVNATGSGSVTAPAGSGAGQFPVPAVSGNQAGQVTAPAGAGLGDFPTPVPSVSAQVFAAAMQAAGAMLPPGFTVTANIIAGPADAAADMPAPSVQTSDNAPIGLIEGGMVLVGAID